MQQRYMCALITTIGLTAVSASAQNNIESFGGGLVGTDYEIVSERIIRIYNANGIAYAFWAEDNGGGPGTGIIDNIILDDPGSMTGDFSLLIADPNYPNDPNKPGAAHWRTGDLRYDGGTSTVLGIRLAGNICGDGDGNHANIYCENVSGDITVGGSLSEVGAGAPTLRVFKADSIVGDIKLLGGMIGDIDVGSFDGDLEVGDDGTGSNTKGDFWIRSNYDGSMLFTDSRGYEGKIHIMGDDLDDEINGDFTGNITVNGTMSGSIEIDGDMIAPCRIHLKWFVTRINGGQPPNIHVHGSIIGSTSGDAIIEIGNGDGASLNLSGTIAIDGNLTNAVSDGPEILTRDLALDARAAIVVDYDGLGDGEWETNATIVEYHPNQYIRTYYGNDPGYHIY